MKVELRSLFVLLPMVAGLWTAIPVRSDITCGQTGSAWAPSYLEGWGDTCNEAYENAVWSGAPLCGFCNLYWRCPTDDLELVFTEGWTDDCEELAFPPPKYHNGLYLCGGDYYIVACSGC